MLGLQVEFAPLFFHKMVTSCGNVKHSNKQDLPVGTCDRWLFHIEKQTELLTLAVKKASRLWKKILIFFIHVWTGPGLHPADHMHWLLKLRVARLLVWFVCLCLHYTNGWGWKIKICLTQRAVFSVSVWKDMATRLEMKRNFTESRKALSVWMLGIGAEWSV